MKEMHIALWLVVFCIWLAGAVGSFCEIYNHRWRYPSIWERVLKAILWPIEMIYGICCLFKWICKSIRGE